jgi:uncharacterized protein YdiU (UPF0061 family)
MHGLGVPTTRALSLVTSPQPIYRETVETAAVVARVAPSFVRFGHFEHFAARDDQDSLRKLADYVVERYMPDVAQHASGSAERYAAFLAEVAERTARMIALWQAHGFCHGVMNTDNMSILGLTIDYGPFQYLQPQRYRRPLCLCPPAAGGVLEPVLPGPGAAAVDRRRSHHPGRVGALQNRAGACDAAGAGRQAGP